MTLPRSGDFERLLVLHAVIGRAVDGVCVATDALIATETRLTPAEVRDVRRSLHAAGILEFWPGPCGEWVAVLDPERAA